MGIYSRKLWRIFSRTMPSFQMSDVNLHAAVAAPTALMDLDPWTRSLKGGSLHQVYKRRGCSLRHRMMPPYMRLQECPY